MPGGLSLLPCHPPISSSPIKCCGSLQSHYANAHGPSNPPLPPLLPALTPWLIQAQRIKPKSTPGLHCRSLRVRFPPHIYAVARRPLCSCCHHPRHGQSMRQEQQHVRKNNEMLRAHRLQRHAARAGTMHWPAWPHATPGGAVASCRMKRERQRRKDLRILDCYAAHGTPLVQPHCRPLELSLLRLSAWASGLRVQIAHSQTMDGSTEHYYSEHDKLPKLSDQCCTTIGPERCGRN